MPRREVLLLAEMVDAGEQAGRLAADCDVDTLESDRQRRDALLWNFTVLGEAAARLPERFRAEHAGIDWTRPSRLRNRIVHGYWSIDLGVLLATAVDDLPAFVAQVQSVLDEIDSQD